MAKTKDALAQLKKEFRKQASFSRLSKRTLDDVGDEVIRGMKEFIAKGRSPITGRVFKKYKNPKKYPGPSGGYIKRKYPDKKDGPVNLKLSGEFLDSLTFRSKRGKNAAIIIRFNRRKSEKKEDGHRKGVNKQPKRPIIPLRNETFTLRLRRLIKDRVLPIVRRSF